MNNSTSKWVTEVINSELVVSSTLKKIYYTGRSKFQEVDVVELGSYGKCLMIDGHMQSAEQDEYRYHEGLIHPAFLTHPNPQRVFLAGGGEGATLREILKHKSVQTVVMVDIDDIVIETSKVYLPNHHQGSFQDPRVQLYIEDAKLYLETKKEEFDVIVMDLPDPLEDGPAYLLYTQTFFQTIITRLKPGGVLVTQSGPGGIKSMHEVFSPIFRTLDTVFEVVAPFTCYIPSFSDHNAFIFATKPRPNIVSTRSSSTSSSEHELDPRSRSPRDIDRAIEERIIGGHQSLRFYDGITHQSIFSLSKDQRHLLDNETIIITKEHPRFRQP